MKTMGIILVTVAILYGLIAFNLEVAVSGSSVFERINNSGLMDARRNHLSVAEAIGLAGVILIGIGAVLEKLETFRPSKQDPNPEKPIN